MSNNKDILTISQFPSFFKVLSGVSTVFCGFSVLILSLLSLSRDQASYNAGKASYVACLLFLASSFHNALGYTMTKSQVIYAKYSATPEQRRHSLLRNLFFMVGGVLTLISTGTFLWTIYELGKMFHIHSLALISSLTVSVTIIIVSFTSWFFVTNL